MVIPYLHIGQAESPYIQCNYQYINMANTVLAIL